jgi:predicted transcriptional regulator
MIKQLDLEFDVCSNRHKGNIESQIAYEKTSSRKEAQLQLILGYITGKGAYGATSDEISADLGIYIQTCSARCSELKAGGHVKKKGTRLTSRGSPAAVLVAI